MKLASLFLAMPVLCVTRPSLAQTGQTARVQEQVVGTWKLVSYVREDGVTGAKSNVMGDHPSGYIHYGLDGRMIVVIVGSGRRKPAGPVATPDEAEALIRSMLAYAGRYTIDSKAGTITHQIDVSWDESRTGESFVRHYRVDRNQLTLTTEPENDPVLGSKTIRTLTFEKLK